MWKGEFRQATGVRVATYGVGFFLYGLVGIVTGELLGLDSIHVVHQHRFGLAVGFLAAGAFLTAYGWRRPE